MMKYIIRVISLLSVVYVSPNSALATCKNESVHYTDPVDLGWFNISVGGPFCIDVFLPQAPKDVLDDLRLFTPTQRDTPQIIDFFNLAGSLPTLNFDASLPLAVVTHGFQGGPETWLESSKDKLLNVVSTNVLLLRWTKGSGGGSLHIDYPQAAANTRMTGAILAYVLEQLKVSHGIDMSKVTIIGHSLGAHVAGHAGERTDGLGRIIGLDPAGPWFIEDIPEKRLDPSDAHFVQCIHTNGGEFGNKQPLGHVDIYMNDGFAQPGCTLSAGVSCSHSRSHQLFEDSLVAQTQPACVPMISFPCPDENQWDTAQCIYEATTRCDKFGYFLNGNDGCSGVYHMATTSTRASGAVQYMGQEYSVAVEFDSDGRGKLLMKLEYADGTVTTHDETVLFDGYTTTLRSLMSKPVASICTHEQPVAALLYYKQNGSVTTCKIHKFILVDQQGRKFSSAGSINVENGAEVRVPLA